LIKTLTSDDIIRIAHRESQHLSHVRAEGIDPFVGKGDNKKIIIKNGLKIRHDNSGLIYTVLEVKFINNGEKIDCICFAEKSEGNIIIIPHTEFKNYSRA
jgi:hypothetical protein